MKCKRAEKKTEKRRRGKADRGDTETRRRNKAANPSGELSNEVLGAAIEVHKAQLLTYMKILDIEVGYLLNFNVWNLVRDGRKRLILQ